MYTALFAVSAIYVVVSTLVVVLMSVSEMEKHQGHVLAIAGQAVMGKTGFILLGSAAMLATASAVNATLFGDAKLRVTGKNVVFKIGLWRTVARKSRGH